MESEPQPQPEEIDFEQMALFALERVLRVMELPNERVILYEGDPETTEGGW